MKKEELQVIPEPRKVVFAEGKCTVKNVQKKAAGDLPAEGYRLRIEAENITLEASGAAGFFYGECTLRQLRIQFSEAIPCMEIEDSPAYPYRGFHLDCVRHFIPVDELKKMIDCAAAFKLNQFHWHFSDDQGYRLESEVYPLLTSVGSVRAGDHFGNFSDDTPEQHFYTKKEVREIVAYAAERAVNVVPEIDLPGHVTAILAAYPQLGCRGEKLEVATKEGIYEDILCAGKEEVYTFLENLLGELTELFPGPYFHIGGDEVPKTRWKDCPCCRKKMEAESLKNEQELQGYLANRAAAFLKSRGKTVIAWNETALGGNLDPEIVLQLWNDDPNDPALRAFGMVDEQGNPTGPNQGIGAKHIRRGGDVLVSNMLSSYCDYPHAFVKLPAVLETPQLPQKCEEIPDAASHVRGGEALCWTEHIRTAERLEYQCWPRYAAKAESLWSGANRNSETFLRRLTACYPLFEQLGIHAASLSEAMPDSQTAGQQMLEFMHLLNSGSNESYREANQKV